MKKIYKICFYVPIDHLEGAKNALFNAGAGKIGDYSHCAWQVLGEGQFMPLEGSQPTIGMQHQLEKVPEYRVEMVCDERCIKEAIAALRAAHPYEEPAYQVMCLENF